MSTYQKISQDIEERLEVLIDAYGLDRILTSIVIICDGKADHLRSNWQDESAARVWERAAGMIYTTASKIEHAARK